METITVILCILLLPFTFNQCASCFHRIDNHVECKKDCNDIYENQTQERRLCKHNCVFNKD